MPARRSRAASARATPTPLRPARLSTVAKPSLLAPRQQSQQHICQGLFGLGAPELAVIVGVVALVFGPSKLPELGKSLGKTAKSFQSAAKEFEKELKEASKPDEPAEPPKSP